jgi:hypothetical protein
MLTRGLESLQLGKSKTDQEGLVLIWLGKRCENLIFEDDDCDNIDIETNIHDIRKLLDNTDISVKPDVEESI